MKRNLEPKDLVPEAETAEDSIGMEPEPERERERAADLAADDVPVVAAVVDETARGVEEDPAVAADSDANGKSSGRRSA